MNVAMFVDVVTRDGRNAIEVRQAIALGEGYIANSRGTLYSCAYDNQIGRLAANRRAQRFCEFNEHIIVHVRNCESNHRAAWQ